MNDILLIAPGLGKCRVAGKRMMEVGVKYTLGPHDHHVAEDEIPDDEKNQERSDRYHEGMSIEPARTFHATFRPCPCENDRKFLLSTATENLEVTPNGHVKPAFIVTFKNK
jgi:hypothetical protein